MDYFGDSSLNMNREKYFCSLYQLEKESGIQNTEELEKKWKKYLNEFYKTMIVLIFISF